jgi:hypothetical protein
MIRMTTRLALSRYKEGGEAGWRVCRKEGVRKHDGRK